jgi:hypothetical protein
MQALMAIRQMIAKRIGFDCTETIDATVSGLIMQCHAIVRTVKHSEYSLLQDLPAPRLARGQVGAVANRRWTGGRRLSLVKRCDQVVDKGSR